MAKQTKPTKPWPPERVYVVCSNLHREVTDASDDEQDAASLFEDGQVEGRKPALYEARLVRRLRVRRIPPGPRTYEVKHVVRRSKAEIAVGLGEPGGFSVDPKDSERLLELRQAIDEHLGWRNEREEEAGDYVERVTQAGFALRTCARLLRALQVVQKEFELPELEDELRNAERMVAGMVKPKKKPARKVAKRARKAGRR